MKVIDLTGKVFGNLTAIKEAKRDKYGVHWECQCVCGNIAVVRGSHLRRGRTISCGCKQGNRAVIIKHGHAMGKGKKASPEYGAWLSMMARCKNPKTKHFRLYGGRGISFCKRWRKFENFLADMGLRPSNEHSLDRWPNKNGNYKPSNCRWATEMQQQQNKNTNVYYEYGGKRQILEEWARELDADPGNIGKRLKLGYSFDEVYNHYKTKFKKRNVLYEHDGRHQLLSHWAKELGVNHSYVIRFLKRGRTMSEIFNYYKFGIKMI